MNKEYQGNSIELRAKELLASIQGNCPDMIWNEISIELAAKRSKESEKWLNKYNTPRAAVIITICIAIVTLVTWKFVFSKKSNSTDRTVFQSTQPAQQIVNNTPPVKQAPATIVPQPKKDSVVVTNTVPVQNATTNTVNSQPVQIAMNNNKPVVLQKPVIKNNATPTNSTDVTAQHSGGAAVNTEQPDSTFTLHRSGMAPMSSGAAAQDTATN